MDFIFGFLFVWLVCGVSLFISNAKDLPLLAKKTLPMNQTWHPLVYVPLWWLMCIILIIIYPAFYIRGNVLKIHDRYFKNSAR